MVSKTVDASRVESYHVIRPGHLNVTNRLYGGLLMSWMDELAGVTAKKHAERSYLTVSADNFTFIKSARQNDTVVTQARLVWVGSSSMEIQVDAYVEYMDSSRELICTARFMMVAIDEDSKPTKVPQLILQTEDEHLAWAHGEERRRIRNQRREAKLDGI